MRITCLTEDKGLVDTLYELFGKEHVTVFSDSSRLNDAELLSTDLLLVDLLHSKIPVLKDNQINIATLSLIPKFEEAVFLMQSGVRGYGNRKMMAENLRQMINTVLTGQLWMPPDILAQLIGGLGSGPKKTSSSSFIKDLSKREQEVAKFVEQGLTNQKIADKMYVSLRTVKAHLSSIYDKTGIKNRLELAVKLKENA